MSNKEAFIKFLNAKRDGYIEGVKKELKKHRQKFKVLKTIKGDAYKRNKEIVHIEGDKLVNKIKKCEDIISGKATDNLLSQIESLGDVDKVSYNIDSLTIETNDIIWHKKGMLSRGKNIGKYIIKIRCYSTNADVSIERKDGRRINECSHPFICPSICWGAYEFIVAGAKMQFGIYTLAMASIRLLNCTEGNPFIKPSTFYNGLKKGDFFDERRYI